MMSIALDLRRRGDRAFCILRITQDGQPVGKGILGDSHSLDMYYAYGIRNSFGLDFDPVTGVFWETENGPSFGDELNLVEPGLTAAGSKPWAYGTYRKIIGN